jgi:hypothetical protein
MSLTTMTLTGSVRSFKAGDEVIVLSASAGEAIPFSEGEVANAVAGGGGAELCKTAVVMIDLKLAAKILVVASRRDEEDIQDRDVVACVRWRYISRVGGGGRRRGRQGQLLSVVIM